LGPKGKIVSICFFLFRQNEENKTTQDVVAANLELSFSFIFSRSEIILLFCHSNKQEKHLKHTLENKD
jgi:hypothetical protein